MRDYATTTGCRMEFLRRQLDDEAAAPCGRCDNCTGPRFTDAVSAASLDAARGELGRPGVEVEPRKMWPTGLPAVGVDLKGRIPAGEQAASGRALGRLSDIGWGNRLRPMLSPQAPDEPVPDDVAKAVVGVLADWAKGPGGWASGSPDAQPRPVGVVTMASHGRPRLIQSLGARIAEVGRLPLLGSIEYAPGRRGGAGLQEQQRAAVEGPRRGAGCRPVWPPRWPRPRAPSCSWTTRPRPAGRWRWPRVCSGGPEHRGCCRWSSPCKPDPGVTCGGNGQGYMRRITG